MTRIFPDGSKRTPRLSACEVRRLSDLHSDPYLSPLMRINPKFTVESYTRILPYKYQSDKDRTIQGLRKAGLP